jgi:hypothetical protein
MIYKSFTAVLVASTKEVILSCDIHLLVYYKTHLLLYLFIGNTYRISIKIQNT